VALKELDTLPQILGSAKKNEIIKGENILSSLNFKVLTVSNSESAEFVKLMCNIWRDSIFAISNDLAIIGESLNLDTFELIDKANFEYPRAQISRPGPVNGPCLSKDTYILLQSLPDFLQKNRLIESARILNESLEEIAFNKVLSFTNGKSKNFRVLFLGAEFKGKPKTNDFRESFTKNLLEKLLQTKLEMDFSVWDPNLAPNDLFEYSRFYKSNFDNDNYDIIIIGNNSDAVSSEEVRDYLNHLANDSLIVDMWGVIRNSDFIQAKFYQFGSSTRI
jgi:UDP-N-acetyl-D-mannosaminuronic acid dehydrogenase